MKITLKALAFAAFATLASLAAPSASQAQDLFYNDGKIINIGNGFYDEDDYRPRHHVRPRHHRNGFSFELQFGNPQIYYQPRHPRVIYRHRPVHQPRPVIQISRAHVQWCYNRYRTYDHRSNSFVIRHGQRAYCVSPYAY